MRRFVWACLPSVALLLFSPVQLTAADYAVPKGYQLRTLKGFTVLINDKVLEQKADRWGRKPLDVLETEFDDLKRVAAPKIAAIIQEVPVWVEWDSAERPLPGVVAVYIGGTAKSTSLMGSSPMKINCIQLLTLKRLGELRPPGSRFQQIVLLHEMAHAVHHRLLGWDAANVKSAFQQAVDRKLYDEVNDRHGRKSRAYARTNAAEYFAELSCAYLDSCHYYPFTYENLKVHDPVGFKLMEEVWKKPEQFLRRRPTVETPRFSAATSGKK